MNLQRIVQMIIAGMNKIVTFYYMFTLVLGASL